jgi:xanthine dehydrogenase accessory factor
MRELADIVKAGRLAQGTGRSAILATVVEAIGSSYRKPGAMMLVDHQSWLAGSISGGCLERDLLRRAEFLTANGPALHWYDTSEDGEGPGATLGCGGKLQILVEAFTPSLLSLFEATLSSRETTVNAISLREGEIGRRVVFGQHQHASDELPVQRSAQLRAHVGAHGHIERQAFWQHLQPPKRLVLVGAGHDALPLVELSIRLGFDTRVIDFRAHLLSTLKAPFQMQLGLNQLSQLPLEKNCAVVLASHHFEYDRAALAQVCSSSLPAYIGVLGTSRRTQLLLEGLTVPEGVANTIHSPTGLDLGGDGPEAVALSILSHLHAVLFQGSMRTVNRRSSAQDRPQEA